MISEGKKTVTKVTKLHSLIINELRVTFAITNFKKFQKLQKLQKSYMQKAFVYRALKVICNFVTFVTALKKIKL